MPEPWDGAPDQAGCLGRVALIALAVLLAPFLVGGLMSERPPEASHLTVEPYDEDERVEPPEWYDDTINVGDVANAEAPQ